MFCNKCGNEVNGTQQFCNKCGNVLTYNIENGVSYNNKSYNTLNEKKNNILIVVVVAVALTILLGIILYMTLNNKKDNYYFDDEVSTSNVDQTSTAQSSTNNKTSTKGKYKTAIITDNVYSGVSISNIDDANKLIMQDSLNQKQSDYPKEIMQIENNIIQKYSITAVNLKEMDIGFAKEMENVIEKIYTDYPGARGHLTNLTLTNLNMSEAGVIALFRPIFMFGTSNTSTTRPWVIKTQVELNAKFFLNPERIQSAVETSSKSGHFPPNATKYSPVAHEFGHYLSFIALLNYHSTDSIKIVQDNEVETYYNIFRDFGNGSFSKKMLDEAYKNYVKDNGNIDFDEWRGKISEYALAKDEAGNYIYDESIAEAFHDVYLNGENSNIVSKYIVNVLKKYIEG